MVRLRRGSLIGKPLPDRSVGCNPIPFFLSWVTLAESGAREIEQSSLMSMSIADLSRDAMQTLGGNHP
jgi:hypothetical protein